MLPREYTLSQYDSSPPLTASTISVIVIYSAFNEQVEEPGIYLSTYWFFWNFGIQYKVDNSQFSSFFGIFSDDMNDLWFAKMSSFSKLVFLEGIPEFLEIPNSSYCSFGVNQQSFTSFLFLI